MKNTESVRTSGLIKLIGGGFFSFIILTWIMSGHAPSASGGVFKLILLAMPLVAALMGLLEFLSDRPFSQFSNAWDHLAGWQGGILGIIIIIFAIVLMMALVVLFA